jgi:imidazolonepropionase-like amidohydrolase
MRPTLRLAAALTLLASAPAAAQTTAIINARIFTVSAAGEIKNGMVLIRDGKILYVGSSAALPPGATVVDARGAVVTPGLMAASTDLTASEVGGVLTTRDDTGGGKIGAAFDIAYGVNPASTLIPLARQGGVTRAMVTPLAGRAFGGEADEAGVEDAAGVEDPLAPAAGLFAGRAAAVSLAAGQTDPVFKARAAMVADLGDAGARTAGSHAAALLLLRQSLEEAKTYAARKGTFDKGGFDKEGFTLSRADLEALAPVAEGRTPLLVRAHRASDIRQLLKIAKALDVKLVIEGAEEGWLAASELAASRTPVLIDPEADLPEQFETLGARLDNPARLQKAGVLFALEGSRGFDNLRQARFNAGTAVANGLSYEAALAAVTLNPARIWGVSDRIGSVEAGKDADLVIWSGDPFETSSYPLAVFIAGEAQPMTSRGLKLRDRYAQPADGLPSAYH